MNPSLPDPIFGNFANHPVQQQQQMQAMQHQMNMPGRMPNSAMQQVRQMQTMGQMAQMQQMGMQNPMTVMQHMQMPMQAPMQPQMPMQQMMPQYFQAQPRMMAPPQMQQMQQMPTNQMMPNPAMNAMQPMQPQMMQPPMQPNFQRAPNQGFMMPPQQQHTGPPQRAQQQQQPKRRQSKVQKHASPPAAFSPPQPLQPVQTMARSPVNEYQSISEIIEQLGDEKQDIFYSLFEIPKQMSKRSSEERFEKFKTLVMPKLVAVHPNAPIYVTHLLEQLRNNDNVYSAFREPPLPVVFHRKRGLKVEFRPLCLNGNDFEINLPAKLRKENDAYIVGTLYSPNSESISVTSFQVERVEIPPRYYCESRPVYMISVPGRPVLKIQVQVVTKNTPFMTWLVIQYVTKKSTEVFVREALKIRLDQDLMQISVRTGNCRGCSFDPVKALDRVAIEGSASCPQCGAPIELAELQQTERKRMEIIREIPPPQMEVAEYDEEEETSVVVNDDPALKEMRPHLYDQIASLLKPTGKPSFGDLLFESHGNEFDEDKPFELMSTEQYLHDFI